MIFACIYVYADNKVPIFITPEDFGCVSNDSHQAEENSIGLQKTITAVYISNKTDLE